MKGGGREDSVVKEGREKGGWMGRGGEENGVVEGRRGGKRGGGEMKGGGIERRNCWGKGEGG